MKNKEAEILIKANALNVPLRDETVQCCVTSPPYWGLRDYGVKGQLGAEETPKDYVSNMVGVFREVRRVLREDGLLWVNIGDSYIGGGRAGKDGKSYASGIDGDKINNGCVFGKPTGKIDGYKTKDLAGIPWMTAFALREDGWYLRADIIWAKPNPMPESVTDRPTKAHEYIFMLSKSPKYYYDAEAVKEKATSTYRPTDFIPNSKKDGGAKTSATAASYKNRTTEVRTENRNRRSVWTFPTQPYAGAHFAAFPETLPKICILASTRVGDIVLDPFGGSGTTTRVATELGRKGVHIDLGYHELAKIRCTVTPSMF